MTGRAFIAAVGVCVMTVPLLLRTAHAQSLGAKPPAFYISEFEVTDPEGIRPYGEAVESTFAPFGGRFIARGGSVRSLEGDPTKRIVMIAFPSVEQAQAWYDSPAYRAIWPVRHRSAKSKVFIVDHEDDRGR